MSLLLYCSNVNNILIVLQGIQRQEHMPTAQQYQDLQSEAAHKKLQTDQASVTVDKLQQGGNILRDHLLTKIELKDRQTELEKISSLEQKIPQELKELQANIDVQPMLILVTHMYRE